MLGPILTSEMEITVRIVVPESSSGAGRSLVAALRSGEITRQLPGLLRGVKEGQASATLVAGSTST